MHRNKIIIILGSLVALMPFVGFPRSWEALMQVLLGLLIIAVSVWAIVDKRLALKAKARARQDQKSKVETNFETSTPPNQPLV